jgi:hypothetical protein
VAPVGAGLNEFEKFDIDDEEGEPRSGEEFSPDAPRKQWESCAVSTTRPDQGASKHREAVV